MVTTVHDEIFAPDAIADPHTYLGRLREEDPVHWNAKYEVWIVTRYDDVVWLVRRPELFSSESLERDQRPPYPPVDETDAPYRSILKSFRVHELIQNDPPGHTRMRGALHRHFTPKLMEQWRSLVQSVVHRLLDEAQPRSRMDVMEDLAVPLPLLVIAQLLGIPEKEREFVRELAKKRMSHTRLIPDRMRLAAEGTQELAGYLTPLIEERLAHPKEDLLSLLAAGEKNGVYSRDEALANAVLLIDAGHETTINLICNGTLAFLRHPDQWALLARDDSLAAKATEECLRYDPPVKALERIAAQDVELRGKRIHEGDRVRWAVVSANRDPRAFADPDTFDITRWPNHHVAFGSGIHYCLGQYLARLEGQEVFKALAQRCPSLRLESDTIEYVPSFTLRTVKSLWVSWN